MVCYPIAPSLDKVYVTDASLGQGAVVSTRHLQSKVGASWKSCDKRGRFTRLVNFCCAAWRPLGFDEDVDKRRCEGCPSEPLGLQCDVIGESGGAGRVSCLTEGLRLVVPPMVQPRGLHVCDFGGRRPMLEARVSRFMPSSPRCSTFSPAASPAVRPYACLNRGGRCLSRVFFGDLMALRNLVLLRVSCLCWRPVLKELTFRLSIAWLKEWCPLLRLGLQEVIVETWTFGRPPQKECPLLACSMDVASMSVYCSGDYKNAKIKGNHIEPSAVYVFRVDRPFVSVHARALRSSKSRRTYAGGLVSLVLYGVLQVRHLENEERLHWKRCSHICPLGIGYVFSLLEDATVLSPTRYSPVAHPDRGRPMSLPHYRSTLSTLVDDETALSLFGELFFEHAEKVLTQSGAVDYGRRCKLVRSPFPGDFCGDRFCSFAKVGSIEDPGRGSPVLFRGRASLFFHGLLDPF